MKKTLIALAALAATASFAQSTVTISGVLDAGYRSVNAPVGVGADTKGGFQNGTATSAILITGTEDLGGGMTALFRYELNPDFVGGSGLSGSALAGAGTSVVTSNGANGYNFVGITTKDMGAVRFGRLNTGSLGAWGIGSVFGTALGSGYGTNGNMYTVNSSAANNFNQTTPTRFNGAVEYTSANINGFTARALFVPKVDNTGAGSTDASSGGLPGVNRAGVTDFALAYNQGPLNASVAQQKHKFGANPVSSAVTPGGGASVAGATGTASAVVAAATSTNIPNANYTLSTLAANYTFGATTIYGASYTEKQTASASTAVALNAKGMMVGIKHTVGALSYMANYGTRDDKSTTDFVQPAGAAAAGATTYANSDRKLIGLGVDYALSKRTNLWARYQSIDPNTNRTGVNTTQTGNTVSSFDKVTTTAVGVRHSF